MDKKEEASTKIGDTIQAGKVVRVFRHGTDVQVLCADQWGLLSVYFEYIPFFSFYRTVRKAGMKLAGLQIEFNRDTVYIPALGTTCPTCSIPTKKHRKHFLRRISSVK